MPNLKELISFFEMKFPTSYQENYDNSGLLYGDLEKKVTKALITIDINMEVVKEAKSKDCNLIISHHPLVFKAIKSFTGASIQDRALIFCIKNDIAVLCLHTNVDNHPEGLNARLASMIGVDTQRILKPFAGFLKKLAVFTPQSHTKTVRDALFNAGAGFIGNYENCSFNTEGTGTFKALEGSNPFVGNPGNLHSEPEIRTEVIFPMHLQSAVIAAMKRAHPYEEVAYDIYSLDNNFTKAGSGILGILPEEVHHGIFLQQVYKTFRLEVLRYSPGTGKPIKKVAICTGSGAFLIEDAIKAGADAFITGDLKYHDFQQASGRILAIDMGHFESEIIFTELISEILKQNFPNFAAEKSACYNNPVCVFSPSGE